MFKTEVRVNELPFDEVEYDFLGRILNVTTYSLKGLKVIGEVYRRDSQRSSNFYNCNQKENGKLMPGMVTGIYRDDLPEKVRKLFDAGTKDTIAKMVRDGEFIRVRLE